MFDVVIINIVLMFAIYMILQQCVHPGSMTTVGTRIERLDLAEVVHMLLEASPVAVPFATLEAAKIHLTALPDLWGQCAAVESH